MKKWSWKPIWFMVALTMMYTTVLASINAVTVDRIRLNERLAEQLSFLYVLDIPLESREAAYVNQRFQQHVEEMEAAGQTLYRGLDENEDTIAYIIPISGNAVWGELRGIVALAPSFDEVVGVDFLSHSETPGLGGRIDELDFKEQFRGISIDPEAGGDYLVFRPDPDGQVDAISGATGTSNAVRRIFNEEIHQFMTETREAVTHE